MAWWTIAGIAIGLILTGVVAHQTFMAAKPPDTAPNGDWDKDNIPNNLDIDDDNDGLLDWIENEINTDPFKENDIEEFIMDKEDENVMINESIQTPKEIFTQSAIEKVCIKWGYR